MNTTPGARVVRQAIVFGFLATFVSSFGQTFFIGLFSPHFAAAAGIAGPTVSLLYGIATLVSGSLLFWLGGAMDRLTLARASALAIGLLCTGCLLVGRVSTAVELLVGFFLLRLGGQGLLTQLAIVAAARNGSTRRGATIAWASMGVIAGEAVLPAAVLAVLAAIDWRMLWLGTAVALLLIVLPGLLGLQRCLAWQLVERSEPSHADAPVVAHPNRRDLLRDRRFWAGAAIMLIPPFMTTGFLFEQITIAHAMHWNAARIGAAFTLFAALRAIGTWCCGRAADRIGSVPLARLHLLPLAVSFASLALPLHAASLWVAFAGLGLTNGANSVLSGALWVELFGPAAVGLVRGVFGAAMVLASAMAPSVVAYAMAGGVSASRLGLVFAAWAFIVPLIAGPVLQSRNRLQSKRSATSTAHEHERSKRARSRLGASKRSPRR